MSNDTSEKTEEISIQEIENCISILERLVTDTDQIFEIPKPQRTALIKASGQLSRPSREEFSRRKKDAKKAEKRRGNIGEYRTRRDRGTNTG